MGPVFETATKDDSAPVVGVSGVRRARECYDGPLAAIGGISGPRVREALAAGADAVAVIGAPPRRLPGGSRGPRRGAALAAAGGREKHFEEGVMAGKVLDGKRIAAEIRAEAAQGAAAFREGGRPPGLSVVLVGDDPASAIYVRGKMRASQEAGIRSETHRLPASAGASELGELLDRAERG